MITSSFKLVFKVAVLHTYFEQSICNCLQFSAGADTLTLIKRFGFKLKNNVNGFELYVNSDSPLNELFKYISNTTDQTLFDFDIVTNNKNFTGFTDLPFNWVGQLLYNSQASTSTADAGIVQLSETLSKNQSSPLLGNLKLNFNDILKFSAETNPVQFNICFKARATQWRYFIINKSLVQLSSPAISGKTGIDFTGPENITLETGQQAMLFSSDNTLIPLSERPMHRFDLVNKPSGSTGSSFAKASAPKVIFKGLPNPDPSRFGLIEIDKVNQVSSPMYVYV